LALRAARGIVPGMAQSEVLPSGASSIGALLQYWRKARHMSQLRLATEADVSPRHLCFLETGRARPSREMVLLLSAVLDVPLRERNALLLAAGFAPVYRETSLDAPELAPVRQALGAILKQQEPFPAVVLNRRWEIVTANQAARRFVGWLLGGPRSDGPVNLLRAMFDPQGLRPHVANWEAVAEALIQRVRREAVCGVADAATTALIEELLSYPDVPRRLRTDDLGAPLVPVVAVQFSKDDRAFNFFSTVTTLGTAQDVTLQELRIEAFFPADSATEQAARRLLGSDPDRES
jgi:transcriptional regulator with XRE-family HTH domain